MIIVYEPCRNVIDLLDSPVCSIADGDPCCPGDDESKYTLYLGTYAVFSFIEEIRYCHVQPFYEDCPMTLCRYIVGWEGCTCCKLYD